MENEATPESEDVQQMVFDWLTDGELSQMDFIAKMSRIQHALPIEIVNLSLWDKAEFENLRTYPDLDCVLTALFNQ